MSRLTIKEGPLVFIRDIIVMEILAFTIFFAISYLANYEMLYRNFGAGQYVQYHTFVILVFSFFQIGYIMLLFLHWYFSYYEIREHDIVRKTGLLSRHRKSVSLHDVVLIETHQSLLNRIIKHADIHIKHRGDRMTVIRNVSNFDECVLVIRNAARIPTASNDPVTLANLIKRGENSTLEFKQTLRYDGRKGESSKDLEHAVLKTIVAFLNSDGGLLLIGVADKGNIVGLEHDYKSLPKQNRDGFENHLIMLVKTLISVNHAKYVSVSFETIEDKEVCVVNVNRTHKPAYLKIPNGDKEEFFVRVGNSSQPFSMSQAEEYIRGRFT